MVFKNTCYFQGILVPSKLIFQTYKIFVIFGQLGSKKQLISRKKVLYFDHFCNFEDVFDKIRLNVVLLKSWVKIIT